VINTSIPGGMSAHLSASGAPRGAEFQVNTFTNDDQKQASVGMTGTLARAYRRHGSCANSA